MDGSSSEAKKVFYEMRDLLQLSDKEITLCATTFQEYASTDKYDIVLLHNSINHIDEAACIKLLKEQWARDVYVSIFRKLASLVGTDGLLIIADCTRTNFWPAIGLSNPIMPTIEWHKHQTPQTWISMLIQSGFVKTRIRWSSFNRLRSVGRFLFGNKYLNYFLLGHFSLEVRRSNSEVSSNTS
jgi:hypothetical protein